MKNKIKITLAAITTLLLSAVSYHAAADWYCYSSWECQCDESWCEDTLLTIDEALLDCDDEHVHCADLGPRLNP